MSIVHWDSTWILFVLTTHTVKSVPKELTKTTSVNPSAPYVHVENTKRVRDKENASIARLDFLSRVHLAKTKNVFNVRLENGHRPGMNVQTVMEAPIKIALEKETANLVHKGLFQKPMGWSLHGLVLHVLADIAEEPFFETIATNAALEDFPILLDSHGAQDVHRQPFKDL